jgi:hypothetical protein
MAGVQRLVIQGLWFSACDWLGDGGSKYPLREGRYWIFIRALKIESVLSVGPLMVFKKIFLFFVVLLKIKKLF